MQTEWYWCAVCDLDIECVVPERAFDPNTGEEIRQVFVHYGSATTPGCGSKLIPRRELVQRMRDAMDRPPRGSERAQLDGDAVMKEVDDILRRL